MNPKPKNASRNSRCAKHIRIPTKTEFVTVQEAEVIGVEAKSPESSDISSY